MRERKRDLYFSVVTGTRYRTKTPPGQQRTKPCAGDMMGNIYIDFKCGRWRYAIWFGVILFVFSSPIVFIVVVFLLGEANLGIWHGGSGVGVVGLCISAALDLVVCYAEGGRYRTVRAFCFWKALHILTNLARASIPFFVPRIVASL